MAKLVWVGSNPNNKGKTSSKGYTVRRIGKSVVVRYGSIETRGGGGGKFYWLNPPREKRRMFRSEAAAKAHLKSLIASKEQKGYEPLAGLVRIFPPHKG